MAVATLGANVVNTGRSHSTAYAASFIGAVLLEASVFAHEIGHCVMARRLGLAVVGLRLWVFGGLTQVETEELSPTREYAVAVVGPIVSLILGSIFAAAGLLAGERTGSLIGLTLFWLGAVNGLLGAYNMVPGLPFDGGRVLRAAVWGATGRASSGTRVAARAGFVAAAGTAVLALHVPDGASQAVVSLSRSARPGNRDLYRAAGQRCAAGSRRHGPGPAGQRREAGAAGIHHGGRRAVGRGDAPGR